MVEVLDPRDKRWPEKVSELMSSEQPIETIRVYYGRAFPSERKEAAECQDKETMSYKVAYWYQREVYRVDKKPMSPALTRKTEEILSQPLPTGEETMAKAKTKKTGKKSVITVRSIVLAALEKGKPVTVEQLNKEVQKVKPGSKFNSHHLSWYRNDFIAKGLLSKKAIEATQSVASNSKKTAKKSSKKSTEEY